MSMVMSVIIPANNEAQAISVSASSRCWTAIRFRAMRLT